MYKRQERIETGKAPQLLIGACDGDLIIRGGSEPTLHVRGEYTTEETADGYRLSGRGDLRIIVPAAAGVRVDEVSGNLIVKGLAGACEIGRVYGDAILTEAGPARLEAIHGDLTARATQSLAVGEVHGDADARRTGGLALRAVYGDCTCLLYTSILEYPFRHGVHYGTFPAVCQRRIDSVL